MYYRYKIKNKNSGFSKIIISIILIVAAVYSIYTYQDTLFIWRYAENKLQKKLSTIAAIKNKKQKMKALNSFSKSVLDITKRKPTNVQAYYILGTIYFHKANANLPGSFSELVINDKSLNIPKKTRNQFIQAIKYFEKAQPTYIIKYSKSLYFTSYASIVEIFSYLQSIKKLFQKKEDIRFYALISIYNNKSKEGIAYLKKRSNTSHINDLLFLATLEKLAKQYTGAIEHYKTALSKTTEQKLKHLIHFNLGEIYFNQSLYQESLNSFTTALTFNKQNSYAKIWIGKNYNALGQKNRARVLWKEVLKSDKNNKEAKILLGIIKS